MIILNTIKAAENPAEAITINIQPDELPGCFESEVASLSHQLGLIADEISSGKFIAPFNELTVSYGHGEWRLWADNEPIDLESLFMI